MNFCISSHRLGNETEMLRRLGSGGEIGYMLSASDFSGVDPERRAKHIEKDMNSLRGLGLRLK